MVVQLDNKNNNPGSSDGNTVASPPKKKKKQFSTGISDFFYAFLPTRREEGPHV